MKARFKLDKKTLQAFGIEHGEKVAFGLVGLCALVLIYLALSEKGYDKKPPDLAASIDNAESNIARTKPEPPPECVPPDLQVGRGEIRWDEYACNMPFDQRLVITRKSRDMPRLLAVEKLHAVAGVGAFAVAPARVSAPVEPPKHGAHSHPAPPPRPDSGMRGERFVVVTGLVPLEKQREVYKQCFQTAQYVDPRRDTPSYVGFFVQRVELSGDSMPDKPQWSPPAPMSEAVMAEAIKEKKWSGLGGELAEPRYVDKELCYPLPPRKDRSWGSEVVCEPEVPALSRNRPETFQPRPEPGSAPDGAFGKKGAKNVFGKKNERQDIPVRMPGPQMKEAEFGLFRYFDFDVKPGHRYSYRVFLALENPNFKLPPQALKDPDDARTEYIGYEPADETYKFDPKCNDAWSAPSEPVAVPEEVQVLAVKVQPQRDEPAADIRTVTWLEERGELAPMTQGELHRGRLLDFPNCSYRPEAPRPAGSHAPRSHTTGTPVNYLSGQILVDMLPWRLGDGPAYPGEVLVLDRTGKLVMHDVADDLAASERMQAAAETHPGGPMVMPPGSHDPFSGSIWQDPRGRR